MGARDKEENSDPHRSITLTEAVCQLISRGHINALDYGYSWFKTMYEAMQKLYGDECLDLARAVAVGMAAVSGDKEALQLLTEKS